MDIYWCLGVGDPRLHLASALSKLSVAYPGRLNPLIQNGLTDADRSHLQNYLTAANVTLS